MIKKAVLVLLGFAAVSLLTQPASAITIESYSLTIDDCTGGCGPPSPFGTVELVDSGTGSVTVTETLSSDLVYAKTGAGDSLAFDLSNPNAPGLIVTSLTTGFTYEGAGSFHNAGTGTFTNAIDCTGCGPGTSSPELSGPISFTISDTANNISAASFLANAHGNFFASDVGAVLAGGNGHTGLVASNSICPTCGGGGGGSGAPIAPEPGTILLMVTGLGILGCVVRARAYKEPRS